jgi:mevalonate kinase
MTWAYGKAILLGEHAVVYGHAALAGAIDCRLECALVPRPGGPLRLLVPAWNIDITSEGDHPLAMALRALVTRLGAHDLAAELTVDTRLPAAAGLGSSAALSVALVRALAQAMGTELSDARVEDIADSAERCFHEDPSGVDVALATRGGMGLYVRGQGLTRLHVAPFALAVGLSGQARRTADLVARVAAARRASPAITDERLAALGDAARAGADAVVAGDLARLGQLMSGAHQTLAALGVSTPALDALVRSALSAGALGAKLTGAGGGGAVIAAAGSVDQAAGVVDTWRALGYQGFACNVGVSQ